MCGYCQAPTEAQKDRRRAANCERAEALKKAREYGVVRLCEKALICTSGYNESGNVAVYKNAGMGYTVKWCDEVVFASRYLTQITTVHKITCWIGQLQEMAEAQVKKAKKAQSDRETYEMRTREIRASFSSC